MNIQETSPEEKNWAIGAHLSAFASLIIPFGNIIGPLIVWLVKRQESEFVNEHGKAALNFQISFLIYTLFFLVMFMVNLFKAIPQFDALGNNASPMEVFGILGGWIIWLVPILFIGLFKLIVIIIAAIKAGEGKTYKYPLTIPFIH